MWQISEDKGPQAGKRSSLPATRNRSRGWAVKTDSATVSLSMTRGASPSVFYCLPSGMTGRLLQ